MKTFLLATALLLVSASPLLAQSGSNGPASPTPPAISSVPTSKAFQQELEADNLTRMMSARQAAYFEELTSCLESPVLEEWTETEDSSVFEKQDQLSQQYLLALDEQQIEDPESTEEGVDQLHHLERTRQVGEVALMAYQLQSVNEVINESTTEEDLTEILLLEELEEEQEPIRWLVQVELGKIW